MELFDEVLKELKKRFDYAHRAFAMHLKAEKIADLMELDKEDKEKLIAWMVTNMVSGSIQIYTRS